jgi:hypothetical protein
MGLSSLLRLGARTEGGVSLPFNPTELYERLVFRLWQCLLYLLRFCYRAICGAQGACLPRRTASLQRRVAPRSHGPVCGDMQIQLRDPATSQPPSQALRARLRGRTATPLLRIVLHPRLQRAPAVYITERMGRTELQASIEHRPDASMQVCVATPPHPPH